MTQNKKNRNQLALQGGSYSLMATAIVLAILIVANIFVGALPASMTNLDISASKLYSITSNTKAVVNNLQQDVTIYWVVQAGQEDSVVENLLSKYDSLSSRVSVVKKNPDVFPTFAEQYTDEEVLNNSLVVESGDRYRYIAYENLYETVLNTTTNAYEISGFDGEGAITSAIDYVITEDLPVMYLLEGHGEAELPSGFAGAIERENIITRQLSLRSEGGVPEDADAILIYAPESDISQEEQNMLANYAAAGGKLMILSGPVESGELTNLNGLIWIYGVNVEPGIIIEGARGYYAFGYPYILMPQMVSHPITDSLIEDNYSPILPLTQGLVISGSSSVNVLLSSSDTSYSKPDGFALETYDMEEGDPEGPFVVAVSIETDGGGEIVYYACSSFVEDAYNDYSSGANVDLAMNSVSHLIGEREAIAIRSKSLDYHYLTISESSASLLKVLMIGVFPLTYLGVGILVILRKRGKQNEAV